jgi:hypothetical protein
MILDETVVVVVVNRLPTGILNDERTHYAKLWAKITFTIAVLSKDSTNSVIGRSI